MIDTVRCRLLVLLPGLLLLAGPAHAQLAGTLFTQPEERVYLDYLRQEFLLRSDTGFDIQVVEIPEIPVEAAVAEETGPGGVTFGGIMNRRDGSHSIWLNGRLLAEDELPNGMSLVTGDRSTSLRIVQEGSIFILRPGQTVNLATGTIIEQYQRIVPELAQPPLEEAVAIAAAPEDAEEELVPAEESEDADPVPPLAAAIRELTAKQGNELAETLAAEEADDEDKSEEDEDAEEE